MVWANSALENLALAMLLLQVSTVQILLVCVGRNTPSVCPELNAIPQSIVSASPVDPQSYQLQVTQPSTTQSECDSVSS